MIQFNIKMEGGGGGGGQCLENHIFCACSNKFNQTAL